MDIKELSFSLFHMINYMPMKQVTSFLSTSKSAFRNAYILKVSFVALLF